jgi:hypothetical protein
MSSGKRGRKLRAARKRERRQRRWDKWEARLPFRQPAVVVLFDHMAVKLAQLKLAELRERARAGDPVAAVELRDRVALCRAVVKVEASREELQALGVLAPEQPEEFTQAACRVLGAKPSGELLR